MYGVLIGRTRCGGCGVPLPWPNTPIPVRTLNQFVVLTPIEDWSGRFYDSYQREQQREQEGRQRLADELVAGSNPMSEAGKRTATPGAGAALRPLLLERLRDDLAIIRDLRIQRDAPRATATPALSDAEVEARIKEALARADAVTRSIDDICLQRRPLCDPYASAGRRTAVWRDARDGLLLCGAALARLPDRDAHRLSVEPLFDELFAIQHDMGATPGTPDEIYGVARRLLRVYQSMNADEGAVGYEDARTGISRIGNVLALMAGRSISVSATNDRAGTPAARHGVAIPDVIGWLNHAIGFGNKIRINGKNYYGPDTDPVIQQAKGFHLVQIGTEWGNPVYKRCYCDGSICGTVPNGNEVVAKRPETEATRAALLVRARLTSSRNLGDCTGRDSSPTRSSRQRRRRS